MARLLVETYPDGAYFHLYHSFECAVSGRLILLSRPIPDGHSQKIEEFLDAETEDSVKEAASVLEPKLNKRNESLYVKVTSDGIREPGARFRAKRVARLAESLSDFLSLVKSATDSYRPADS